jgi:hypothetical protein
MACAVEVSVFRRPENVTSCFCLELSPATLEKSRDPDAARTPLPQIADYSIKSERLRFAGTELTPALEILYQSRLPDADVIVIREEHNSFSNPMRILAALAGHPVQVSTIGVVVVRNGKLVRRWNPLRTASSYDWRAVLR